MPCEDQLLLLEFVAVELSAVLLLFHLFCGFRRYFSLTFAEHDILFIKYIVSYSSVTPFSGISIKTVFAVSLLPKNATHVMFICSTPYHLRQTSATPPLSSRIA